MSHWKDFLEAGARGGRYLPWKEVGRATGLSRTTAWRLQKRGEFPAPYAISPGRVGYREDEVEAWRVSRDHSGARIRPTSANLAARLAPCAPSDDHSRGDAGDRRASSRSQAVAAAGAPSPAILAPPTPRSAADPPARRGKPGRRRSEHAQAIAQQIRFDF